MSIDIITHKYTKHRLYSQQHLLAQGGNNEVHNNEKGKRERHLAFLGVNALPFFFFPHLLIFFLSFGTL